ncbi:MAG: M2 family metallopeptidase [Gemmatimonadaceae bacterium]|nr:M2 family metallopeptidase [Gemmatimonadaceae bacterium]
MRRLTLTLLAAAALTSACATVQQTIVPVVTQATAQQYLDRYSAEYQRLYYASSRAEWASNTRIVSGDSTNSVRTGAANEAFLAFVGSTENISTIRAFLSQRDKLTPLQVRQLEAMLYGAGSGPQTIPEIVKRRVAAEAAQTEKLYGYTFTVNGKAVTPNEIDSTLRNSTNLNDRRAYWESSKAIGPTLKSGILELRDLRNKTVQALGYSDFFSYQVSDYEMTSDEMLRLTDSLNIQLRPLFRELHTWARYELAKKYGQPVPALIPADWLPNRWGQDWSSLVNVEGMNLDDAFKGKTAEWVVQQGENFYKSLGFDALPQTFWDSSSLYPLPANSPFKKNTHASAWHLDLANDVRSLMSVEPNEDWYGTVHHELGHIYYYQSYTRPEVPLVLRGGANRAYHEGIGTMMQLAAGQRRFLANRGMISQSVVPDTMRSMLKEALQYAVFIPFSTGTMTRFEHSLYAENLSANQFNAKWWELARKYQGIVPPTSRGENFADALTKTHINDDPGQYYDYALSQALLFQLHNHIAKNILHQSPYDTDYYGNKEVGTFLRTLMAPGASRPWRDVLRETTGRPLNAQAMVDYFQPLHGWLKQQNLGRTYTLPDLQ